ncbi:thioesterase family protein [Mycobacterium sp. 236(2023)]|uniref:acyl-CoA thioesterase n=1 Tax=Mycobacterium sp. 236(2023) TaxID=3038163 RepID=UPI00241548AE|nr:thioesterase family protein [Mycobacterium sp. 236(2023)]MDG4668780.1 thioesterase family protein [Mycobacterium sp. 236(2023)]
MAEHPFDDAIRLDTIEPGRVRGKTSAEWANMVGPFGGMTAALLLRAIEIHPDRIGDPVALTVNFTAPVADGEFDITASVVRTNRSNQHWMVELSEDGTVVTNATAVFGLRRDTWSDTERLRPAVPEPDEIEPSGLPPMVVWARNYDMRFVDGPIPGKGADPAASSTTTLWARDRVGRPLDFPALAAVSDIFYPRVFLRRGAPVPAGTISLTTYFHAGVEELTTAGGDFVLCQAHANRFSRGYFDQSAEIWSRTGELLVTTHQLVYFKT